MASGVTSQKYLDMISEYDRAEEQRRRARIEVQAEAFDVASQKQLDIVSEYVRQGLTSQECLQVDVGGWLLAFALERHSIDNVIILVERGAPMDEVATAYIKCAHDNDDPLTFRRVPEPSICNRLVNLIAAAHLAQRGDQLCQDIKAALTVYPNGKHLKVLGLPLPPSNACEQACAKLLNDKLLSFLLNRGARDDQTRIEQLVRNGAAMPRGGFLVELHRDQHTQVRLKMLFKASCKAGREAEFMTMLQRGGFRFPSTFLDGFSDHAPSMYRCASSHDSGCVRQKNQEMASHKLQPFRDVGLLGPLAEPLSIAIAEKKQQIELNLESAVQATSDSSSVASDDSDGISAVDDILRNELNCLVSCEHLLMEYAEADRRYARYIATMLGQRTTGDSAKLIASFYVAEPADTNERRREYEDSPAYTWKEFVELSANVRDASRRWVHAMPASHEEHLEPIESYDEDTVPTSGNALGVDDSVIDFVLHMDPPARMQPEIAAQLVAVMEASAVERQLGRAVLEEAGTQEYIDRLVVLQFNRCSKELRKALVNGLPLKRCREELEKEGYDFLLPCRNMIFVHPDQYHVARRAALPQTGVKLSCFYLIVSESLEYLVEESLVGIGAGAWARARETLPLSNSTDVATVDAHDLAEDSDSEALYVPCVIKRTFLQFGAQPVRNAASVEQSTTELHGGGVNPRRLLSAGM